MYEKEKLIKENRLIEATRKGLTGLDGKLGCILHYLGQPIKSSGSSNYNITYLEDVYTEEKEGMPTCDEDEMVFEHGRFFDGLGSGMHLEIKYLNENKELLVNYEGNLVYCEVAGDLENYVPSAAWEDKIDKLFGLAKKREKKLTVQEMKMNKFEDKRNKLNFLERMRVKWGI